VNIFGKGGVPVGYFNHADLLPLLVVNDSDAGGGRVNNQIFILSVVALHTCNRALGRIIEDYILSAVVSRVGTWLVREIFVIVDELPLGVANEKLYDLCVTMDKRYES
jgi:hypothetical protein